jgi:hypothetical protein
MKNKVESLQGYDSIEANDNTPLSQHDPAALFVPHHVVQIQQGQKVL